MILSLRLIASFDVIDETNRQKFFSNFVHPEVGGWKWRARVDADAWTFVSVSPRICGTVGWVTMCRVMCLLRVSADWWR